MILPTVLRHDVAEYYILHACQAGIGYRHSPDHVVVGIAVNRRSVPGLRGIDVATQLGNSRVRFAQWQYLRCGGIGRAGPRRVRQWIRWTLGVIERGASLDAAIQGCRCEAFFRAAWSTDLEFNYVGSWRSGVYPGSQ